ncbi:MAG: hypothetical protein JNK82_29985 [Myxococcaceae bacterium]|nr:hypothetical protein [Myxococcaceae bacterium]
MLSGCSINRNARPDGFQTSLAELRQKHDAERDPLIGALPYDYVMKFSGDGKRTLPATGIPAPDRDEVEQRKMLEFSRVTDEQEMCFTLYEKLEANDYVGLRSDEEADFIASRRARIEKGGIYLEAFDSLADVPTRPVLPVSGGRPLTVRSAVMGSVSGVWNKREWDQNGRAYTRPVATGHKEMMYELCGPTPPVTKATRYFTVAQKFKEATLGDNYTHVLYVFARQDEGEPSLDLKGSEGEPARTAAASKPTNPEPAPAAAPEGAAPPKSAGKPRSSRLMSLERSVFAAGTGITVAFAKPMAANPGEQFWITIVAATADDTAYTSYKYLEPDAKAIELAAPAVGGVYEVRLHGNYPTKTYNLIDRLKFRSTQGDPAAEAEPPVDAVPAPPPEDKGGASKMMAMAKVRLDAKSRFIVKFPKPLKAKRNERYWVAIASATAGDADYTTYAYVEPPMKAVELTAPDAVGEYEVRLHGNYPTKQTNVVDRLKVTVK